MYVPAHFAADDDAVTELLVNHGAGDLVTATARGLLTTRIPWVYDPERHALHGHLARANPQWRTPWTGEAMVLLREDTFYVTPNWYASRDEDSRVSPSFNYRAANVHGELVIRDDVAWVEDQIRRLAAKHEAGRPRPWTVDEPPRSWVDGLLPGIVGVELVISRIEAKTKMSQNRAERDVDGIIAGVEADGRAAAAEAARRANHRS
ncbi:FMN-binding negative transcriptional regulator [Actinorhabdospora filicis]|uniref:FMN-binding negative transcriptional regulator n=1 Tax=Actinorhabdospora filicis TaxID=1785913 RepID=UPI00255573F5|nr:FMN-binding negative transcriptional regulator [Actinorhabdospora filicis]